MNEVLNRLFKETMSVVSELNTRFGDQVIVYNQDTIDDTATLWIDKKNLVPVLKYLKTDIILPYNLLYDLTAIDERTRKNRNDQPKSDFTVVYHLTSFERNDDLRIKVALNFINLVVPSITSIWESANWYEREVYDMFGIMFEGHPRLTRILMPKSWEGFPLRKDHYARATEQPPFVLTDLMRTTEDN